MIQSKKHMKLVLASTSFRRQELFCWLGLPFDIVRPDFDESAVSFAQIKDIDEYVKTLALGKALSVIDHHPEAMIVSADTVVYFEQEVLGKPKDLDDAKIMLSRLLGHEHTVYTGVTIANTTSGEMKTFIEKSKVTFRSGTEKELKAYINTSESLGKAGSYSIAGGAKKFVEKVEGSWTNVLGLPLISIAAELEAMGIKPKTDVANMINQNLGVRS